MTRLDRSIFLKEVKDTFPELRAEINRQHGLLHLEMRVFLNFAQRAIATEDAKDVAVCFKLAEKYAGDGNDQLRNAIGVSFVEGLQLTSAPWAWKLLGPILQREYREYLHLVSAGMAKPLPYL